MSAVIFTTIVDISQISGSGVATRELIRGLGSASDEPLFVVCPEPARDPPEQLEAVVEEFVFVPPRTDPGSPRWHVRVEVSMLRKLWTLLRREDPLLVVTRLSPSTLFQAPLCRLFGVPHVLLIRGWVRRADEYGGTKFGRLVELLVRLNVRLSTEVFVAFDELKSWVEPYRGESQSSVTVLPNAVDPTRFSPTPIDTARTEIGLDTEGFVVGFVGSLAPRHEVSTLIRAASGLDDVELLIVGDGELRTELEELAATFGIRDQVTFTGQVDHEAVPTYISAMDAGYGVVSPEKASNPIKCYEYMACERPVITSAAPEMAPIVDARAGIMLEEVTRSSVSDAIRRLSGMSAEQRRMMGQRGRRLVAKNHTWEIAARRMLSVEEGAERRV